MTITTRKDFKTELAKSDLPSFRYGQGILVRPNDFNLEIFSQRSEAKEISVKLQPGINIRSPQKKDNEYILSTIIDGETFFEKLQEGYCNRSIVLEISKDKKLKKPIILDLILDQFWHVDYILIVANENSEVEIIERQTSSKTKLRSSLVEVIAKENSKINYTIAQILDEKAVAFDKRHARVFRNGEVNWNYALIGSNYQKLDVLSILNEENAKSKITGICFGENDQKFNINNSTKHLSHNTSSEMKVKGIASDKANLFVWGSIDIAKEGAKSVASEKIDMLVLNEKAQANAIPDLFVSNKDVQCSHGAAISELDNEKLFYLESRGIAKKEARKVLVEGFINSALETFSGLKVGGYLKEIINSRIEKI